MKLSYVSINDLQMVLEMFEEAREDLRLSNVDQWQDGYPNRDTIIQDINLKRGYLLIEDNQICGYCVLMFTEDPSYAKIFEGNFHNQHQYATIHRFVIKRALQRKHLGLKAMSAIEDIVRNHHIDTLRVDTHADNIKMQGLIKKANFSYCGIVQLEGSTAKRLAFDKIIA